MWYRDCSCGKVDHQLGIFEAIDLMWKSMRDTGTKSSTKLQSVLDLAFNINNNPECKNNFLISPEVVTFG